MGYGIMGTINIANSRFVRGRPRGIKKQPSSASGERASGSETGYKRLYDTLKYDYYTTTHARH